MDYRWDELLDGQAHLYRAGRDFDLPPDEFAALIEQTAAEFGLTAVVKADGQFVAFRAGKAVHQPATALDYGNGEQAEQWAARRAAGESVAEIARQAGLPYPVVYRAVKRIESLAAADA